MNNPTDKIRLLLVDDHFIVRMGLKGFLEQEPDLVVIGEAGNVAEAVKAFRDTSPDVTLMDGHLPDHHGTDATRRIRDEYPDARIIIFSVDDAEESIYRAMEAGASSYLPKSAPQEELLKTIREVHRRGSYLSPQVEATLASRHVREPLSEREISVLKLAMKGYANKNIGHELGIAEATVKAHVSHILAKLEVSDRTRAVALAIKRGILRLQ